MKKTFYFVILILLLAIVGNEGFAATSPTVTRGKMGKDDVAIWDGTAGDSKFSRETGSGYTLKLNKFDWVGVDVMQEYGGGVSRSVASILSAVSDIGTSQNATIWLAPGTWTMTSEVTIPKNIALSVPSGVSLVFSKGVTLWLKGSLDIGDYPVFECTQSGSTVVFLDDALTGFVRAKWFNSAWNAIGVGKVPDRDKKLDVSGTIFGTTSDNTFGKFTTISAKSSSGIFLTEDSGVSGISIADTGIPTINAGTLYINSVAPAGAGIYLYTPTANAQFWATSPASGASVVYLQNMMASGTININTRSAVGGTIQNLILYSNGTIRQNESGVTHYFGPGTASIWESSTGELWTTDDAGNNTLQTSHDPETNLPVFMSSNSITGEGQTIKIGQFFKDAAEGKFANGFKPEDVAQYAKFDPPQPSEIVRARLLAKEAKEREVWKKQWIERNTLRIINNEGKTILIPPSRAESDMATQNGFKPYRPKWLKERAGL